MAMFVTGHAWLHVQAYIVLNFASLCFLVMVRPYTSPVLNFMNICNELLGLSIGYLILQIQDNEYEPDQQEEIGDYVVYLLFGIVNMNMSIVLAMATI